MTKTLKIEIETVIYDEGEADEETLKEIACTITDNSHAQHIKYEYALNPTDYPTDADVQAYVETELTKRGETWDSVVIV